MEALKLDGCVRAFGRLRDVSGVDQTAAALPCTLSIAILRRSCRRCTTFPLALHCAPFVRATLVIEVILTRLLHGLD